MKRSTPVLFAFVAVVLLATAAAVALVSRNGSTSTSGVNPLSSSTTPETAAFEGIVVERVRAGSYLYLRIHDGTRD